MPRLRTSPNTEMASKRSGKNSTPNCDLLTTVSREVFSASDIGAWDWDIVQDKVRCNDVTATLFGLKRPDESDVSPIQAFEQAIHPDDVDRFKRLLSLSVKEGRFFVAEYRTVPRPGRVCWVLARGTFTRDESGKVVRGTGILIDITHIRQSEFADQAAYFFNGGGDAQPSINTVAEKALALWEAAQALEPKDFAYVKPLLESVLLEIGQQLATSFKSEIDVAEQLRSESLH